MPSAPPHRIGQPSPLVFHLTAALTAYSQALLAAPRADSPTFPWADDLGHRAAGLGHDLDQIEIACEIARRLLATVEGLEAWQTHPYRRTLEDPPRVWESGCSRLLDYGATAEATDPKGPPVLVIPSLINRPHVLDLIPGRSLLRWLAAQGLRPLLLDWGMPDAAEAGYDLDAYGRRRLLPALLAARALGNGEPVPVIGYCMGGTLAAGLAARRPDDVSALVTIGAPWDFSSPLGVAGGIRAMLRAGGAARAQRLIESLGGAFGQVPVSVFQTLFAMVNPMQASLKFQKLARLDPDGQAAQLFVALEDWLAEGVPMPTGAAIDLLIGWHIHNLTARGGWHFLGGHVLPQRIAVPALIFNGSTDFIAPPPVARALGHAIPHARLLSPQTGHVGMVVGSLARQQVWRPIAEFLTAASRDRSDETIFRSRRRS